MAVVTDQPSITCPKCGRTSYNPTDIKVGWCGNCHEYTQDGAWDNIKMDPRHLDRPNHPDFWRMVAQVKQLDRQAQVAQEERGEPILIADNIDPTSIAYMSQQRVIRAHELLPEDPDGNNTGREAAIWVDGFVLGKRYAEALARGEVLDAPYLDGNRRQRRAKRR